MEGLRLPYPGVVKTDINAESSAGTPRAGPASSIATVYRGARAHEVRSLSLQCKRASQRLGDQKLHQIFPIVNAPADSSIPPEPASASLVRNPIACLRHARLDTDKTIARSRCRGRVVLQPATRSSSSLSAQDRQARARLSVPLLVAKVSSPWTSVRCARPLLHLSAWLQETPC